MYRVSNRNNGHLTYDNATVHKTSNIAFYSRLSSEMVQRHSNDTLLKLKYITTVIILTILCKFSLLSDGYRFKIRAFHVSLAYMFDVEMRFLGFAFVDSFKWSHYAHLATIKEEPFDVWCVILSPHASFIVSFPVDREVL